MKKKGTPIDVNQQEKDFKPKLKQLSESFATRQHETEVITAGDTNWVRSTWGILSIVGGKVKSCTIDQV